jgi:hypothetical protein
LGNSDARGTAVTPRPSEPGTAENSPGKLGDAEEVRLARGF